VNNSYTVKCRLYIIKLIIRNKKLIKKILILIKVSGDVSKSNNLNLAENWKK
jgi:hypothetical protein